MEIRVDIDRTLCTYKQIDGKKTAIPLMQVIRRVNRLYDEGNRIIIWTSRNKISKRDQTEFTKKQLESWGVKYHELDMSKPLFDLFIDDRAINVSHWMQGMHLEELGDDFE